MSAKDKVLLTTEVQNVLPFEPHSAIELGAINIFTTSPLFMHWIFGAEGGEGWGVRSWAFLWGFWGKSAVKKTASTKLQMSLSLFSVLKCN